MCGIEAIAVRLERRTRCIERLCRPAEVTRHERNFRLGDDTSRPSDGFLRTKGARRAPQQSPCSSEITELRHGDPAKRERRCIVAESDPRERAERIARSERPGCGGDQRVHWNPATLVTPTTVDTWRSI